MIKHTFGNVLVRTFPQGMLCWLDRQERET